MYDFISSSQYLVKELWLPSFYSCENEVKGIFQVVNDRKAI